MHSMQSHHMRTFTNPESTTNLMPSIVTLAWYRIEDVSMQCVTLQLTSAMFVDTMTLRLPSAVRSNTASCSSTGRPA